MTAAPPPDTEFERGLRRFGALLLRVKTLVVAAVLAVNMALGRPIVDTLLFAAALAVGLSPELLPAILTITLSHGARVMAREGVIVKRLNSIENLGSMDVLCTDKTGTLTRGTVELDGAVDTDGGPSNEVLRLAVLNARLQAGLRNALDQAVSQRGEHEGVVPDAVKLDEIPYDFERRRLSVVVASTTPQAATMITKGAVEDVLAVCTRMQSAGSIIPLDESARSVLHGRFVQWASQGLRVLAVATRELAVKRRYALDDETGMTLVGFLLFFDPPEPQVASTLSALEARGVAVKIITGDSRHVAQHVARSIGMEATGVLTGADLQRLGDDELWRLAASASLFAEVDPGQKERIITALKAAGHVVGYLGDGINDAPPLHAADVGISVDTAVDVAKDAADFVLLEHDLDLIRRGIDEGRNTFANTSKYVVITTSANFGNMVSMALASLYLPFLPLLAKQILLNNFLSDIPAMGIAGDNVDPEWRRRPHRWNMGLIRRSMLTFGLTSTAFDVMTFWVLLTVSAGSEELFRTGWFLESLLTELSILLIIRTRAPLHRSRPGRFLAWSSGVVMLIAIALPFMPRAAALGLVALPLPVLGMILGITMLYVLVSESSKRFFYRTLDRSPPP